MKGFNTIGDLSRFAQLRKSNSQVKAQLGVLTDELATGLKSDITKVTGGNFGRLAQIQNRLTTLESFKSNASMARTELDSLQSIFSTINKIASSRGPDLLNAQTLPDESSLTVRSVQARSDFDTIVNALNTQVGGRFLLSGSNVMAAPLSNPHEIFDEVRATVAGIAAPADIIAAVDNWFDSDFENFAFQGNTDTTSSAVAPDTSVERSVQAIDPAFKETLKGLALAALAGDDSLNLTKADRGQMLASAGESVIAASRDLTVLQAEVGMKQSLVAEAEARNSSEVSALSIARSEILAADPYETASALAMAEVSLQNLYALTARVSRLTLTDFIR